VGENVGTSRKLLDDAHDALRRTVQAVGPEDWDRPSPCELWTAAQVLQHAAGDQLGYASTITGESGPSEDPFAPSGQLDDDPVVIAERAMKASAAAWATVAADAEAVPVPVPPGSLPASLGVAACALDAAVHAWDIAVATGQPSPLDVTLARSLMPVATTIVEPLRGYGVFAPALESAADDDDADRLLRFLGRRPDWTA